MIQLLLLLLFGEVLTLSGRPLGFRPGLAPVAASPPSSLGNSPHLMSIHVANVEVRTISLLLSALSFRIIWRGSLRYQCFLLLSVFLPIQALLESNPSSPLSSPVLRPSFPQHHPLSSHHHHAPVCGTVLAKVDPFWIQKLTSLDCSSSWYEPTAPSWPRKYRPPPTPQCFPGKPHPTFFFFVVFNSLF